MVHMRGDVHRPYMAVLILARRRFSRRDGLRHFCVGKNPRRDYNGRAVPFGRISVLFPLRIHFEEDRIHERNDIGFGRYWNQIYYLFRYKEPLVFFAV